MDQSYFTTTRLYCFLSIILIIIFCIFANNKFQPYSSSSSFSLLTVFKNYHRSILTKFSSDTCKWTFDHYSPSSWEIYWYDNIVSLQKNVCPTLIQNDQLNKSIVTLEYIITAQKTLANQSTTSNQYDELLSKMYYRYECSNSSKSDRVVVSQYIEPLIGLLRDPLTICSYKDLPSTVRIDGDAVQSKRFFLLGPSAPYQNFSPPTTFIVPWLYQQDSQKILFDLGSSYFNGMSDVATSSSTIGTRWFYEYFRVNSLYFDRMIAFEASQYIPRKYWNQIPHDIIGKLTFINTGVETTGKFNPWSILQSIAKVEDYVIIKLDIDTPTLENELINQVLKNRSISSLIDEMFFEMHITVNEMRGYWGNPPGELKDTYILFRKLRELGIRMHSWP